MKAIRHIKNERGIALVASLMIMLLLLVLGAAAMQMSQLGFFAVSAEKKYQIANWAAEYAVQEGINVTVANNACIASTGTGSAGDGSYTYYRMPSSNFCYIHGTGTYVGAKVVKTVVVPRLSTAEMGAITLRNGGSISMGGSSSIVNCDTNCKTPGVVYGTGLTLDVNSINDDTTCPNNPRGLYGSPHAVQDIEGDACTTRSGACSSSIQMPDRIPITFEADDWNHLLTRMSAVYSPTGHSIDVANLTISGMSPLVITIPATPVPSSSCECTNIGNFTLTTATTSCSGIADFSTSGCTAIKFTDTTGTLNIRGIPSTIAQIVSNKNIDVSTVSSTDGDFTEKNLYTANSATITINDSDVRLTNAKIISDGNLSISSIGFIATTSNDALKRTLIVSRNGNISLGTTGHIYTNITGTCINASVGVTCETALNANGDITMSTNVRAVNDRQAFSPVTTQYVLFKSGGNMTLLSNNITTTPKEINYLKAEAQGSITIQGSTTNRSILVTSSNSGNILFNGGIINNSTLLTKNLFRLNNTANTTVLTNNRIFAGRIEIVKGSGNVADGLFYSHGNTTFLDGTGNTRLGCVNLGNNPTLAEICAADCNPVLFIIGGNLNLEGRGTVDIFGVVFVNGVINYSGGGGFAITGPVTSNSTTGTSQISGSGNANIRFSSCITNYVRNDNPILRRPACGGSGGARSPYIQNTKLTVY